MTRSQLLLLACFPLLALNSCIQIKPKTLGNGKISLESDDTATKENFKFNFAYLDTTLPSAHARTITLQGNTTSKSAIIATCNGAGTACVCEFLDSTEIKLGESDTSTIQYDASGNLIRCNYPASILTPPTKIRVKNFSGTKITSVLDIKTPATGSNPITLQELFADLNVNQVRTVSRYECLFNFLQKFNATAGSFDCTDQAANPCNGSSDFCLLQSRYPFYLFADTLSSNFSFKIADLLYNAGSSDRICNQQLKRIDCTGSAGTPVADFGLYNEQTGIYQQALGLSAGPGVANQTYGFAAEIDTFLGEQLCPPGLVARQVYEANPDPTTMQVGAPDAINDNNVPAGFKAFSIDTATTPSVATLDFAKLDGGDCDGSNCSIPQTVVSATAHQFSYTVSTLTPNILCVVPGNLTQ